MFNKEFAMHRLLFTFFVFVIPTYLISMEKDDYQPKQVALNIAVGSIAGVAEVIVDQPLIYFKNMLQQGSKISLRPKVLYRGFGVNVACMAPTTAIQIAANKALKTICSGTNFLSTSLQA